MSTAKGGSAESGLHDYYGDVAGVVCNGPVDTIHEILVDGRSAWTGPLERAGQPNPVAITVTGYGVAYFYWGTTTQELASSDPSSPTVGGASGAENVLGSTGHPPYRRQAVIVLKRFLFGREKVSAPSVEVVVSRKPVQSVITGVAAELDADGNANPLVILAEALTDPVFGLGIESTKLDAASWQATADELYERRSMTYISPVLERPQSARSLVDELREYYDGWFRWTSAGKIAAGRFPNGEAPPTFDSSNTITADDLVDDPSLDSGGWAETFNEAALKYQDAANEYKDSSVTVTNGYNRNVVGEPRQVSLERKHITRGGQAARVAAEFLRKACEPNIRGTLSVRSTRAAALAVGSVFRFTHDLLSVNLIARVIERAVAAPPSEVVTIHFEADRALAIVENLPGETTEPTTPPAEPEALTVHRFFQPPRALFDEPIPRLAVLASRSDPMTIGFNLHLQRSDTSLFQRIGTQIGFPVRGLLNAEYSSAFGTPDDNSENLSLTLDESTLSVDLETVGETQSEDMIDDGHLLAIIFSEADPTDFEILTVREGRLSSGSYLLKVRRAQFGTNARSFAIGDECWLIHRSKLVEFAHASFPSLAQSSITAKFRLQSFTAYDEADLSDAEVCPDITFAFSPVDPNAPGRDDFVDPDPITGVSVVPGYNAAILTWTLPTNVVIARTRLFENTVASLPEEPTMYVEAPTAVQWFTGLTAPATRYYWLQAESTSGRLSDMAGPFSVTVEGVNVADFAPGLRPIEVVDALPSTGNFKGRLVVLTLDAKVYRWTNDVVGTGTDYWTTNVLAEDIEGQLTNDQIEAIEAAKLTGQITSTQITDGAISTPKLEAGAITTEKLAADAVTANEIAANAVTATKIDASAVTADKIAANAVTAGAIAAGAITADKVGANEIITSSANIGTAIVTTAKIANAAVTSAKIEDLAVTEAKIADASITNAKIADASITTAKIENAAITNAKISSLSASKITAGTISGEVITVAGGTSGRIQSDDFVAGVSGWRIRGSGDAEFNTITVRVSEQNESNGTNTINSTTYSTFRSVAMNVLSARPVTYAFSVSGVYTANTASGFQSNFVEIELLADGVVMSSFSMNGTRSAGNVYTQPNPVENSFNKVYASSGSKTFSIRARLGNAASGTGTSGGTFALTCSLSSFQVTK